MQKTMELIYNSTVLGHENYCQIERKGKEGGEGGREGERERERERERVGNSLPQRKTQDYQGSLIMYRIFQYFIPPIMGKYNLSTYTHRK